MINLGNIVNLAAPILAAVGEMGGATLEIALIDGALEVDVHAKIDLTKLLSTSPEAKTLTDIIKPIIEGMEF